MPSLPTKVHRRRGVTPTTNLHHDDVWERTFKVMGLQPLTSTNSTTTPSASIMSSPPTSLAEGSQKKPMTILDLPAETIKDIFQLASPTDLVALSLVSKHFRDIAAKQLYRCFHIVFPDEEDDSNDSPIDGLAGGLDTFATSEYDYAQHLREIILETLSGGDKGERAYRHYHYNVSCGKFMNTLLLLTLRKAKALETFRWDIRVELSREVFKALHSIGALQHLHLRMQIGQSIYQVPPAIGPSSILSTSNAPHPPPGPPPPHVSPPNSMPLGSLPIYILPPTPHFTATTNQFAMGSKIASKHYQKNAKALLPTIRKMPPTISGFKRLKSLALLDMDTLDYVGEIKDCIENSSATLKTLKLSFSEALAKQSRKPPPEVHSDSESDQEDEFGQLIPGPPPGPPGASDPNGPSKILKAQEEKKRQEAVLGKIFGISPEKIKVQPLEPMEKKITVEDPKRTFIRNLAPVAKLLMSTIKDGSEVSTAGQAALELITRAAKTYMETMEKTKPAATAKLHTTDTADSVDSSTAKATPASSTTPSIDGVVDIDIAAPGSGLFDKPEEKKKKEIDPEVSNPDDIDIEEPEVDAFSTSDGEADENDLVVPESQGDDLLQDNVKLEATIDVQPLPKTEVKPIIPKLGASAASQTEAESSDPTKSKLDSIGIANRVQLLANHSALRASHSDITRDIMTEGLDLQKKLEYFQEKTKTGTLNASDYENLAEAEASYRRVASRLGDLNKNLDVMSEQIHDLKEAEDSPDSDTVKMSDYVRSTRGLRLHQLAISLIPIKASVLSRAIDLTALQEITLLNVGQQIPFWTIVARENQLSPLPLRKVHTDNVTLPFLTLINQLERVEELFLLERAPKQRVESTALKTTVTMEQIRRIILKRHAATLKVLLIRNDASTEWDLSVKAAMLLCQRAKALEELAVGFGNRTFHTLLQFLPGLESLRILHTIKFSHDDNCPYVMRELRKFIVATVSHNPDMKLEYLALDASVERLVRRIPNKVPVDRKGKGKEKQSTKGKTLAQLALAQHTSWSSTSGVGIANAGLDGLSLAPIPMSWEESDDDDLDVGGKMGLKVETVEGIRFCDVADVRIFKNDILLGRL